MSILGRDRSATPDLEPYEIRHLVSHLMAVPDRGAIHRLLNIFVTNHTADVLPRTVDDDRRVRFANFWLLQHEKYGTLSSFVSDVEVAWEAADEEFHQSLAHTVEPFPLHLQVRYLLMRSSVRTGLRLLPPELLKYTVRAGIWTVPQALGTIEQATTEIQKSKLLQALALVAETDYLHQIADYARRVLPKRFLAPFLGTIASRQPAHPVAIEYRNEAIAMAVAEMQTQFGEYALGDLLANDPASRTRDLVDLAIAAFQRGRRDAFSDEERLRFLQYVNHPDLEDALDNLYSRATACVHDPQLLWCAVKYAGLLAEAGRLDSAIYLANLTESEYAQIQIVESISALLRPDQVKLINELLLVASRLRDIHAYSLCIQHLAPVLPRSSVLDCLAVLLSSQTPKVSGRVKARAFSGLLARLSVIGSHSEVMMFAQRTPKNYAPWILCSLPQSVSGASPRDMISAWQSLAELDVAFAVTRLQTLGQYFVSEGFCDRLGRNHFDHKGARVQGRGLGGRTASRIGCPSGGARPGDHRLRQRAGSCCISDWTHVESAGGR